MTTDGTIDQLLWPASHLAQAIEALARVSGLSPAAAEIPAPPREVKGGKQLGRWIGAAAEWFDLEAQLVDAAYPEVDHLISSAAPAIIQIPGGNKPRFAVLQGGGKRTLRLLGPDLQLHRVAKKSFRAALCAEIEGPLSNGADRVLKRAGLADHKLPRARNTILREQLSACRISNCWLLRAAPGHDLRSQVRGARLIPRLLILASAHAIQYLLWLISWALIGRGALQGHLDWGWLMAWALLLLGLIGFQLLAGWSQGVVAIAAGRILKQRLLCGALRLNPEEIRHQGAGQLLGRVIESEAVESLALSGGFLGLFSCFELLVAMVVLGAGARSWGHVLLLALWIGVVGIMAWRYFRTRKQWTNQRVSMTNDLVERMVGHRTRIAQQVSQQWYDEEDQTVDRYLTVSEVMDRRAARLVAIAPRAWLVLGLAGLAPAFARGGSSPAVLAVELGGLLVAYGALQKLVNGLWQLADAIIAWQQVGPLFQAAARQVTAGSPGAAALRFQTAPASKGDVLLETHELVFRHHNRIDAVLRRGHLRILHGDQLLLEGPSGSGKSTLASLLAGMRSPASGMGLLEGLDLQSLGAANWRKRVAMAPQFHENHVLTGTFAFNLLMGRCWPPTPEDLEEAEEVCSDLGLGDLLAKMPAGLGQMVGETGWQLSHGEKSRLFIARALLQRASLLILDECFAAMDPESLQRALKCVLDRAPSLLVIAHP
jgi:ATP-binding cassette subfamily B protein